MRGSIVRADLSPTLGREQRGTRPALVVSSLDYLASVRDLMIVVPLTTVDRGWPHHVPITGEHIQLPRPSFAMTEQPRTISSARISRQTGHVDEGTLTAVEDWLRDFLSL